jgi:hypothetical protein
VRRTLIVAAIAGAYLLFVFGKRWWNAREMTSQPAPSAAVHPAYAGNELKVLHFLASPASIKRGQPALLCYGVLNAESVRIEPEVEGLKPSLSRCIEVRPNRTTEYKLEARSKAGAVVRASLQIEVK